MARLTKEDYYTDENGNVVFTREYHLKRGYCCKSGCRHCPWDFKKKKAENPFIPNSTTFSSDSYDDLRAAWQRFQLWPPPFEPSQSFP